MTDPRDAPDPGRLPDDPPGRKTVAQDRPELTKAVADTLGQSRPGPTFAVDYTAVQDSPGSTMGAGDTVGQDSPGRNMAAHAAAGNNIAAHTTAGHTMAAQNMPPATTPRQDRAHRRKGRVALVLLLVAGGGILFVMLNFLRAFGCALMLGLPGTC